MSDSNVIQLTREQLRSRRFANEGRPRAKTESMKRMTKFRLAILRAENPPIEDAPPRPRTRSDCVDGPRPCPWVACSHHLFLDVTKKSGAIKFNEPGVEVEDMKHSCALDIADEGEHTLEDSAHFLNITRERIRQIETKALIRVKRRSSVLGEFVEERDRGPIGNRTNASGNRQPSIEPIEEDEESDVFRGPLSFFAEPHDDEKLGARVSHRVWSAYLKESFTRGFDVRRDVLGRVQRDKDGEVVRAHDVHAEEEKMDMAKELTKKQTDALETYRALEKKLDREPTLVEFGVALGCTGDDKAASSMGYFYRRALVDAGELARRGPGGSKPGGAQPAEKKTTAIARRAPVGAVHVAPQSAPSTSRPSAIDGGSVNALAVLRVERARLAAMVSGIDFAIETLGGTT